MATTFIYALCEPGTRTVRYIGKSDDPQKRLRSHLSSSIKLKTHLGCWLGGVVARGERPNLVILKEVPGDQWELAEERYIRLARGLGMALVNGTDGGDGNHNPSSETRAKIGAANAGEKNFWFGKHLPKEICAKIGDAQRGEKNHRFGKSFTPEQRAVRSAAQSGEKNPMFGKTGELAPGFGRTKTEKELTLLREANKGSKNPRFGKKYTEESKAKRRATLAEKKRIKLCAPIS